MVGSQAPRSDRYPGANQLLAERFRRDGHEALLTSRRKRRVPKLLDMLHTLWARRDRYDVVIVDAFSTSALWYARITTRLARALGKRSVVVLRGGRLGELADESPDMLRGLLRRASRVVAPSPFLAREVAARMDVPVEVVPNAVDLGLYPGRVRTRAEPRLFWLRTFRSLYLPEVAIEVVALLKDAHPGVELVMAGPEADDSLRRCRSLARELGVADRVRFPGLVSKPELRSLGDASDVFLNTTSIDNTPVSVIEAMAMGLCVVSTDVGGIPDLLQDGETALLVPPRDAGAMARAVASILERPELAGRLSRNAIAHARQFDLPRVAERWYDLVGELA
jgi:glycosyltransferase involved in cell wall biosynthesis